MTEIINITDRERAKDRLIAQLSAGRDALAQRLEKVLSDRLDLKRSNEALAARVGTLEAAIKKYDTALTVMNPRGARGEVFELWNAARIAMKEQP